MRKSLASSCWPLALLLPLCACVANYRGVADGETTVADGRMTVDPGNSWVRLPVVERQTRWEEVWTWNGPQLDRVTLIGGLPDGKAVVFQERNSTQQVPPFRADMTGLDLMSMVEISYRIRGVTMFTFESVEPIEFLSGSGVSLHYDYVSGIGIAKKGRCVMRMVDGRLYALRLEALTGDTFDAVAPEFERLVSSAKLRP